MRVCIFDEIEWSGAVGVVVKDIQHARRPAQFSSWKFRAYKLDPKRATALLETWFEATSDLPNEIFSGLDRER